MKHERFHYQSLAELREKTKELRISLPFAETCEALTRPLTAGGLTFPNRIGTAPMEGADAAPDGSPSDLTCRRYLADAEGGAGVIWFEAISIVPEGRSSASQLWMNEENLDAYKYLTESVRNAGLRRNGYAPILIMQANHSGRYSNPENVPAPMIACRMPELEAFRAANDDCIVSDEYLQSLEEQFGLAARRAREAGFDAVDIKASHGYLLAEMLSAHTRSGPYGGSYENRTRLLKNSIRAARAEANEHFHVTTRLNLYDGGSWPYGFGVREGGGRVPDMTEPIRLVRELYEEEGIRFLNLTMGNPYVYTHVTRPFDAGKYLPEEHPLEGVARMIEGTRQVKRAVQDMTVFASGPSYLRQYADLYAAGAVEEGDCDGMLFGRLSFADPDFPREIIQEGRINPKKVCVTCGKCGDLIRAHLPTGCVVRHPEVFLPFYREYQEGSKDQPENFRG